MATLTIQLAGLPSVSHVLKDETITIGRMKGNTIVIDDVSVSLSHARITCKNGDFYLKDLNSTNGTTVNGQNINEAKLHDADRVSFAGIVGQFQAEAAATVSPPAVAPAAQVVPSLQQPPSSAQPLSPVIRRFGFRNLTRFIGPFAAASAVVVLGPLVAWKLLTVPRADADQTSSAVLSMSLTPRLLPKESQVRPVVGKAAVDSTNSAAKPDDAGSGGDRVAQLAEALGSSDVAERRRAAVALHSLGDQAGGATAALRVALKDSDSEVRMWAALSLVNNKCYDKTTIPIFVAVLHHENAVLRQLACLSLALLPYEEAEKHAVVPALSEAAREDADDEVRKAAESALNVIAPEVLAKTTAASSSP